MNVTKQDISRKMSLKLGIPMTELQPILDAFFEATVLTLAEGQRIELRGFGAFYVKCRKERPGRNPRTGETLTVPSCELPAFKFSRDAVQVFNSKRNNTSK